MNDQDLLKKTLKTMGMMLGALTVFMGTLTILVLVVVGNAVGGGARPSDEGSKAVPASNVHGGKPGDPDSTIVPARPKRPADPPPGSKAEQGNRAI
jgi:hypothetical protein